MHYKKTWSLGKTYQAQISSHGGISTKIHAQNVNTYHKSASETLTKSR